MIQGKCALFLIEATNRKNTKTRRAHKVIRERKEGDP